MYNEKQKCWESPEIEESVLIWCREPFNRENPEAMFTLANHLLTKASKGSETADAVYLMEQAANLGRAEAALAMGQMFQYGWAVHRSAKTAREWYEKAAALGSAEAAAYLEKLRRAKKRRVLTVAVAVCVVAAAAVCAVVLPRVLAGPQGVVVHPETELITPATFEEFNEALSDLIDQYDNDLVISGQQSTNRLMLQFEGEGIDLSRFPAATVIADEENFVIIQFTSEEEAARCLEALRQARHVLFVSMDEYDAAVDAVPQPGLVSSGIPYRSPYTGFTYQTWGAEFLGMDHLAAWLMTQNTQPVVVAVIDTGVEVWDELADRILPGKDTATGRANGQTDGQGHGTHVSGTILDCTQGLDVTILPVKVFPDRGSTSDSCIVQGLRYAISYGVDVINMSLGGPCDVTDPDGSCDSAEDYYIRQAVDNGIVVVVSAGNGDDDNNPINTNGVCPAHMGECIVVGACDEYRDMGYFSNYGEAVDVCAPGVDILSYCINHQFSWKDGTSMAAPHIAALAAMMKLYLPDKTPAQIEKYIKDYCVNPGDPQYYGEGIPWAGFLSGD